MWVIHLLVKSKAWMKGLPPVINKALEVTFLRVAFNLIRHFEVLLCTYMGMILYTLEETENLWKTSGSQLADSRGT